MFLKEHVDIFNATLIGCFVYFQNGSSLIIVIRNGNSLETINEALF